MRFTILPPTSHVVARIIYFVSFLFFFQIKSDKIFTGVVIYKLEGPGVDQEPKNLFEIDDKTGVIRSKRPLDREKYNSFTVKEHQREGHIDYEQALNKWFNI